MRWILLLSTDKSLLLTSVGVILTLSFIKYSEFFSLTVNWDVQGVYSLILRFYNNFFDLKEFSSLYVSRRQLPKKKQNHSHNLSIYRRRLISVLIIDKTTQLDVRVPTRRESVH